MEVSRRGLLPAVVTELGVALGESRGVRSYRLGELAAAPDDVLRALVPVRGPGRPVHMADGFVCVADESGAVVRLFPAEQVYLDAFNACDGRRDLEAVAELVTQRWELDAEEAFQLVRTLFLHLLRLRVLLPANPGPS